MKNKITDNTILEGWELLNYIQVPRQHPEFYVHAGIYRGRNNSEQLGLIVIDRRLTKQRIYTQVFNAAFCPEDKREWLAQILISMLTDTIKQSHSNTMGEVHDAYTAFMQVLRI